MDRIEQTNTAAYLPLMFTSHHPYYAIDKTSQSNAFPSDLKMMHPIELNKAENYALLFWYYCTM